MAKFLNLIGAIFIASALMSNAAFADPIKDGHQGESLAVSEAVDALYDVISGPVGQARDWDRFRDMFLANAVMGAVGPGPDGLGRASTFSPDGYIERSGEWLVENGFTEEPTRTDITLYGELAYVKSAYEGTNGATGETFLYGVNFITLFKVEGEWKIASILWRQADENWPVEAAFD